MKKLISLCLTFILIAGTIGTVAYAETLPNLLFDLDIQVADDGSYTLEDASANGHTIKKVNGDPILGTNQWSTDYIQFGKYAEDGTRVGTNKYIYAELGTYGDYTDSYADKDAITVETWINVNGWEDTDWKGTTEAWKAPFSLTGRNGSTAIDAGTKGAIQPNLHYNRTSGFIKVDMRPDLSLTKWASGDTCSSNYFGYYKANVNGDNKNSDDFDDALFGSKWAHMVIVRKWIPSETTADGTRMGQWDYDLYVNGKNVGSVDTDVIARVDYSKVSNGWAKVDYDVVIMGKGSHAASTTSTDNVLQMADFKIYDGALSAAQVVSNYEGTRTGFMDVPDVTAATEEALSKLGRADLGKEFSVEFTSAVKAASVTEGSIKILDDYGNEVATEVIPFGEGVTETTDAVIKINDYFAYGRNYTLDVSGVQDLAGSAIARTQIPFTTANKAGVEILEATNTKSSATVTIKNTSESDITIGMFLMVYGSDGVIKKLSMTKGDEIKTIAAGATETVTVSASGVATGDKIRSMAYSVVEGKGRIAFTSPIEWIAE